MYFLGTRAWVWLNGIVEPTQSVFSFVHMTDGATHHGLSNFFKTDFLSKYTFLVVTEQNKMQLLLVRSYHVACVLSSFWIYLTPFLKLRFGSCTVGHRRRVTAVTRLRWPTVTWHGLKSRQTLVDILASLFMPPPLGAGGIVFSGCPSVRPSVRSLKYPLLTCTWVRWSTRPTVTILRHVRPSVCPSVRPSGEVSGHLPGNAWRD